MDGSIEKKNYLVKVNGWIEKKLMDGSIEKKIYLVKVNGWIEKKLMDGLRKS